MSLPPLSETPFLPDFCQPRLIWSGLLLAQLLALVIVLAPLGFPTHKFISIISVSLFVHAVVLSSIVFLCPARHWLEKRQRLVSAVLIHLLVMLITSIYSHLAWLFWLDPAAALTPPPGFDQMIVVPNSNLVIKGMGDVSIAPFKYPVFMLRNLGISAVVSIIALHYFHLSYHWRLKAEAEAEFRVQALQARIHPHFLFNSMNTIASLTRIDAELAEQAVEDLSELFRATLSDAKKRVQLADEISLCERYLRIEGLRLGNRLQVKWQLDAVPKDALVPKLSLQPLLENAIYYGIQPLPQGGVIVITGLTDEHDIKIDIENPLPPADTWVERKGRGNGIALDNLRQRLSVYYGRKGKLETFSEAGHYCVSLRFPYERFSAQEAEAFARSAEGRTRL